MCLVKRKSPARSRVFRLTPYFDYTPLDYLLRQLFSCGKWFGLWGLEFFCELVGLTTFWRCRFGKEMPRRRTNVMLPEPSEASHVYLARRDSVRARGR